MSLEIHSDLTLFASKFSKKLQEKGFIHAAFLGNLERLKKLEKSPHLMIGLEEKGEIICALQTDSYRPLMLTSANEELCKHFAQHFLKNHHRASSFLS